MYYLEIDVIELKQMLDDNAKFILLDVRTDIEVVASIISDQAHHIPMNEIPLRLDELDKNSEIIVHCKSGKRSAKVCDYLIQNNFSNIKNLRGGIIAWSQYVDPSIQII